MKNYLFNHNEQNPIVIDNYPYGFKLRTQIKYWIETTPKKGDRFCSQTLNPKNNVWNKPKKSTYYCLGFLYKDEKGHIRWNAISVYYGAQKTIDFVNSIGGVEKLNKDQKTIYNSLIGINEVKEDEFTGKIKKDYSIKWEKDRHGKYVEVKITFDRPDGVKLSEIYKAMKGLNQTKLNEVFEIRDYGSMGSHPGVVRICTRGGNYLGKIDEEDYREFLASDANTLEETEA